MRGNHHCPACHSSHGFNLLDKIQVRLQCIGCGHIFPFDAVLLVCNRCGDKEPHFENKREGKFHLQEVFAYTCLNCGCLTTKEERDGK